MIDPRPPVALNPPRWRPNPDPASITVPGLDTSAPILDQIEQIDQLITVRLQNIDENFSIINNILASGILPELRRYAVATEPVREAAKFWASFYEHAAQVSIPTYGDSSVFDDSANDEEGEGRPDVTQQPSTLGDESVASTSTNTSFQPTQALYSSTPATAYRSRANPGNQPSWAASFESPVDRLSREVAELGRDTEDLSQILPSAPKSAKGKEPLIRNVFRQNLEDASISTIAFSPATAKRPTAAQQLNPHFAPDKRADGWNGVVDLKSTPLSTPNRHRIRGAKNRPTPPAAEDDDDDSFLELPPGMSPPRFMSPALGRPSMFHLGRTPLKDAAARISKDLVQKERGISKVFTREPYDTTSSTLPTPLSFGRNTSSTDSDFTANESLESMMRRAQLNITNTATETAPLRLRSNPSVPQQEGLPSHIRRHLVDDELADSREGDLDSDSEDDGTDFLVARPSVEDSFSSESSTSSASASMVHEGMVEAQPYYQQPVDDYGDDDSFSDDGMVGPGGDTDTIFGGATARLQDPPSHLNLMGDDLDTVQFGNRLHVRLNPYASQESPTTFRR